MKKLLIFIVCVLGLTSCGCDLMVVDEYLTIYYQHHPYYIYRPSPPPPQYHYRTLPPSHRPPTPHQNPGGRH